MTLAIAVGVLVASGTYLLTQRGGLRLVLGFVLLGHAANLTLLAAGGTYRRQAPLIGATDVEAAADPLPQAFVLTAIVITFGVTVYLLGLLARRPGQPVDRAAVAPAGRTSSGEADEPGTATGDGQGDVGHLGDAPELAAEEEDVR